MSGLVTGGFGQPEGGALVVGGLGAAEADLNAMSAVLAGAGAIVATLTAASTDPPVAQHDGPGSRSRPITRPARMSASLSGKGALTGRLDYQIGVDALIDELTTAILLELV